MNQEILHQINPHKFAGKKIYYSGSIKGAPERDPEFAWKLVSYMAEQGAKVLSEHVAARNRHEMEQLLSAKTGKSIYDIFEGPDSARIIRQQDIAWVDEATHFVALVNAPSHGVGMEIERTLLKPSRGLPVTPILCLVHTDLRENISKMISGITPEECAVFRLESYENFDQACAIIDQFLFDFPNL